MSGSFRVGYPEPPCAVSQRSLNERLTKAQMLDIAIEVSDKSALDQLDKLAEEGGGFSSESQGVDGVSLYTAVMTLTPIIIAGIVKVVLAQIAARKHVRVLVDGVEVVGVSEEALLEIVRLKSSSTQPK